MTPIVLDARDETPAPQKIELRLQKGGAHTPESILVTEARLAGKTDSLDRAFKFGTPTASARGITVAVTVDPTVAKFAGTYTVKLRPVYLQAAKIDAPAELSVQFVRPAAKLGDLPELLLERDYLTSSFSTQHITLTETSSDAFARFPGRVVANNLRGPLGQAVPGALELSSAGLLTSGGNLTLTPSLSGNLPLGTHTGTARLDSPQLAAPVELKLRIVNSWPLWTLPSSILVFICLGILFRKYLVDRQALEQAQLEAQRVFAKLTALKESQTDQKLKKAIGEAMAPLALAIDQAISAQAMQKAAADAGVEVDKLLAEAVAARGVLRAKVVAAKELLVRPGALQPTLRQLIERAQAEFDTLSAAIDDGDLATKDARLSAHLLKLQRDLHAYVQQFATTTGLILDRVGTWQAAAADIASVNTLRAQAEQLPASTSMGDLLTKAVELWTATDTLLSRTLRTVVTRAGTAVVQALNPLASTQIGTELDSIHVQLVQFDMDGRTDAIYGDLASQIGSYRALLVRLLRERAKAAGLPDAAIDAPLAEGNFAAAAKSVADAEAAAAARAPKIEAFGPRGSSLKAVPALTDAPPLEHQQSPAPPPVQLSLVAPSTTHSGQTVAIRAVFTGPISPEVSVKWTVQGGAPTKEQARGLEFSFVPQGAGAVVVRCDVTHANLGLMLSAQCNVLVQPSAADQATLVLRDRVDHREVLMSLITGVFIAGFGTLIFMDGFVGTFRDFFYAAVWGFTVDVGVARLRTLAEPISSKAVPTAPASKS